MAQMIAPKSLDNLDDSKHIRLFAVSDAKIGKTTHLACSTLGALPGQNIGGLVSDPTCLHILAFDEGAVEGLKQFLTDACKRPDCVKVTVWPMYDICRTAMLNKGGWDFSIYNTICAVQQEIDKIADANPTKVYAELISSFTGLGMALKQALAGDPTAGKGGCMSVPKWDGLNGQLQALRAMVHKDNKHVFWEGHTQEKFVQPTEGVKPGTKEETVGVSGNEGRNWAANVKEVSKMIRESVKYPGTSIDKVFLHTRPTLDFNSGGRGFNNLAEKEYDLADMCRKLGKRVGGYKKP